MSAKSPWVPPLLQHPAFLAPAHQWLVIPHSHPTGKDHSASFLPTLPGFIWFPLCQEPCWVLPSSEPLSRLHPAHPLSSPFFLLGKEIRWGVAKEGLNEEVFLSHFAPSLSLLVPSVKVTSLWAAPVQLLLIGRKEEREENSLAFISDHFTFFFFK